MDGDHELCGGDDDNPGVVIDGIDVSKFSGSVTVADLQKSHCQGVPRAPGVYLVLRVAPTPSAFLPKSPAGWSKGKDPNVSLDVLETNWVKDATILYIGKAGGKKGLYQRLKQYMDQGLGRRAGHWGGRFIWQLADSRDLLVCWLVVPDRAPREVEKALLSQFEHVHGCPPFANLAR